MNDISAILQKIQEDARQYGEAAAAAIQEGGLNLYGDEDLCG